MIPLLLKDRNLGAVEADEWVPTEIPGMALARRYESWEFVHIRSGLAIASHHDRSVLATVVPPLIGEFDWTLPADALLQNPGIRALRDTMVDLGLIDPERRPHGAPIDIGQAAELGPLMGAR